MAPRLLKKTYVVLRPEVARTVKIAAAERGTTMRQIVEDAVEKYFRGESAGSDGKFR